MDQLKVYLKLAAKYRFWIAFGISLLLPVIGFVVGAGAIEAETTKREAEIKAAKTEVVKYKSGTLVNNQYQPLATTKKDALAQEVDATWRRLFASQEPLLKWPVAVQDRFRKWGRKYPANVDKRQVMSTVIDYTVAYPEFVQKIYAIFKPFNFDDGSGIIVAPDPNVLLAPAPFTQNNPPDLTQIWAEQERLWVVTALLDAIAKVNESAGAKIWDDAIVKQINLLDVGGAIDQDQKSMAKGDTLVPADSLADPSAPVAAAAAPAGGMPSSMPGGMTDLSSGGGAGKSREVMYLKTESQQYKILPIMVSVLVDQARLANFLVGLENSPMAIEVNEVEIVKPAAPVTKPVYGERSSFNFGPMGSGRGGDDLAMMGGRGRMSQPGMSGGAMGGRAGSYPGMGDGPASMPGGGDPRMGGGGGFGGAPKATGGVNNRGKDEAKIRRDREKKEKDAAAKAKGETKKIDQYYNVIEVKVYGRARFYLAPPPAPELPPSTAAAPETPTPAPNPTPEPAKAEAPQPEATPADATKGDATPKADSAPAPADATKGDAPAKDATPKADPAPPAPKP